MDASASLHTQLPPSSSVVATPTASGGKGGGDSLMAAPLSGSAAAAMNRSCVDRKTSYKVQSRHDLAGNKVSRFNVTKCSSI